jgi:hypothetical protein
VSVLPPVRATLPNLLTLGAYEASARTDPALWLRAAAGRHVAGIAWPEDEPAVVYLPGRGRDTLRGAEDCPSELAPLVWFAVSGAFFGQPKRASAPVAAKGGAQSIVDVAVEHGRFLLAASPRAGRPLSSAWSQDPGFSLRNGNFAQSTHRTTIRLEKRQTKSTCCQ